MRPDQRWFPTNMADRAAWFRNFSEQFGSLGPILGFSQSDIDQVADDNALVQFIAGTMTTLRAYVGSVEAFQRQVLFGDIDDKTTGFPIAPVLNVPFIPPNGVFERLEKLVRRIRVQPAYTKSIGTALGIIPQNASVSVQSDLVPKLKVKALAAPYSFSIGTTRSHYDMWLAEYSRVGSNDWRPAGYFTASPVVVAIEPQHPGQPEMLNVRVRMYKKNRPVGEYSQIETVTVTP